MGLARAFTKRLGRPSSPDNAAKPKLTRAAISMPMGLISTTNQSVHDNPSISPSQIRAVQQRQISSSSGSSLNDSDDMSGSSPHTPAMTDASSIESYSPIEPNHLTQYFPLAKQPISRSPALSMTEAPQTEPEPQPQPQPQVEPEAQLPAVQKNIPGVSTQDHAAPAPFSSLSPVPSLPKRAPSHSKQEHVRLARVRSVRSSAGAVPKADSSQGSDVAEETSSIDISIAPLRASSRASSRPASTTATVPEAQDKSLFNPFSKELMQLDQVAEEFSNYSSQLSWEQECKEDLRIMQEKGLRSHRASEYLQDISALRNALWDLTEEQERENGDANEEEEEEQFHDAVSDWI